MPEHLLPLELREGNPIQIFGTINGLRGQK